MNKTLMVILVIVVVVGGIVGYSMSSQNQQAGTIKVSGAWALYPMMVKWGEAYQKLYPSIKVEVSAGGAGKGMTDALAGLVDIGMVSRNIYPEEIANGAFYVTVVEDAVVPVVNQDNPVISDILAKGITRETFYKIYITGEITTWGQVVGRPEITDPINVYTRSDAAGAPETWANYLGKKQENLLGIGVYGDPGLLDAVKNDHLGIGYNNIGYAYDANTRAQVDGISVVPIDIDGSGQIEPGESVYQTLDQIDAAISQGIFPHPPARGENLVTKGNFTGITLNFVRWILTDGQNYAQESGFVPLSNDVAQAQLQKLR